MEWEKIENIDWKLKDDNGEYLTGWQLYEDNWYYLNEDGIMQTGWLEEKDDKNDRWYYLRETKEYFEDDTIKPEGSMVTGWFSLPSENCEGKYSWYYASPNHIEKDDKVINCGELLTGWISPDNNRWFYMTPIHVQTNDGYEFSKCEMYKGWLYDNDKWYYLSPYNSGEFAEGQLLVNTTKTIDNVRYHFDYYGVESIAELLSDKGADFIGGWEGFYAKAYYDPYYGPKVKDYWTIGYGTCYCSIPEAFPNGLNSTCTREQARAWLKQEAEGCAKRIKSVLNDKGIELNQNQFEALLSFAYNCGTPALFGSSLFKYIISGGNNPDNIKEKFEAWSYANKKYSDGLHRRRLSEANLYNYGDYTGNN